MHLRRRASLLALVWLCGCTVGGERIELDPLEPRRNDAGALLFTCVDETTEACESNVYKSCTLRGEFIVAEERDCGAEGLICDLKRQCSVCRPGTRRCQPCEGEDSDCDPNQTQLCDDKGDAWVDEELCEPRQGDTCSLGMCENMCKLAETHQSYMGCEFYAVDLDNAAIDDRNDAASQQFAVVVTNPHSVPIDVKVEINEAAFGAAAEPREIQTVVVPPGALEVFKLPKREVDGSSDTGLDDGSHTAVTSNAFRVESSHPIIAYQFNPLENVNVFSNDASLLLPTSAIDRNYTVVGWPQTIGDSDNPDEDFDPTSADEDLRAFLTIVGTAVATRVEIDYGQQVKKVLGAGPVPESGPGDKFSIEIGPFDVVNLETEGFNADFTGTRITASERVTVFVGSEASDVPPFGTYATRQCCADHLEEQLFPDATLGFHFNIARMPSRTAALAAAAFDDDPLDVAVVNEPEWVKIVAVGPGMTRITTSLPPPEDSFELSEREDTLIQANQDFVLDADKRIAVLQAMGSQGVTGIPRQFPGGDPAIIAVPPIEQYRRDYIFLTPDQYAFDFLVITADARAEILLDGAPLPDDCSVSPADGLERKPGDPEPESVIYRCQLGFPKVTNGTNSQVFDGDQRDGAHTLVSTHEVGIVVWGFDRFVSYAYAGGLNLQRID
jgi:hypothetical protein